VIGWTIPDMFPAKLFAVALTAGAFPPKAIDPGAIQWLTDRPTSAVQFLSADRLVWRETDGRAVAGSVTIWDVGQDHSTRLFPGPGRQYRRGLTVWPRPNGEPRLVVADCEPNGRATVKAFDPRTGWEVSRIEVPAAIPGGNMVQALNRSRTPGCWQLVPSTAPSCFGAGVAGTRNPIGSRPTLFRFAN
jgi:hypothetical protein